MLKILHNPRCSKSRETLAIIKNEGVEFQIIEYLKETITKEEFQDVLSKLDKKPQEIIRRGEAIFKENFKGKEFSAEEWLTILIENPKLIERPIVFNGKKAVIGRPPEKVTELF
tara:strand:+ start:33 stop:374 length:342 start_codon:yes stop_codon:yes gene_type:complete